MTAMFRTIAPAGTIPARSLTIHRADSLAVSFDGYGTATIDGPKRAELACMVSALPMVLKAVCRVAEALRTRDGGASTLLAELEGALMEAGINPDAPTEDALPMTAAAPLNLTDRFAYLLGQIADRLEMMATDRVNFRAPRAMKDGLRDIADNIRRELRDGTDGGDESVTQGL